MKKLMTLLALATLVGCRSSERGSPGNTDQGTIWSDPGTQGDNQNTNAARRNIDGGFGGSGGTAPGGNR